MTQSCRTAREARIEDRRFSLHGHGKLSRWGGGRLRNLKSASLVRSRLGHCPLSGSESLDVVSVAYD